MSRTPAFEEMLGNGIADVMDQLHTCMPGRVVSYDESTQTADVQPLLKVAFADEAGDRQTEALPIINRVPVVFQRAGDFGITFPLSAGDGVLLVFSEGSIDKWISEGGGPSDPIDDRRHNIADAIAIPGLFSVKGATDQVDSSAVVVSGSTVRLGSKNANSALALKSELDALVTIFNAHVHPVPGVTSGAGSTTSSVTGTLATSPTGTLKVKAE